MSEAIGAIVSEAIAAEANKIGQRLADQYAEDFKKALIQSAVSVADAVKRQISMRQTAFADRIELVVVIPTKEPKV